MTKYFLFFKMRNKKFELWSGILQSCECKSLLVHNTSPVILQPKLNTLCIISVGVSKFRNGYQPFISRLHPSSAEKAERQCYHQNVYIERMCKGTKRKGKKSFKPSVGSPVEGQLTKDCYRYSQGHSWDFELSGQKISYLHIFIIF